jgi:integrase/recombinase XerD
MNETQIEDKVEQIHELIAKNNLHDAIEEMKVFIRHTKDRQVKKQLVSLRLDYNQKLAESTKNEAAKVFTSLLMDLLDEVEEIALNQLENNTFTPKENSKLTDFQTPIEIETVEILEEKNTHNPPNANDIPIEVEEIPLETNESSNSLVTFEEEAQQGIEKYDSSNTKGTFGLYQVAKYFEQSLPKPHNYVRIAKQYLRFLIKNDFAIDKISIEMFVSDKSPSYKSACKKFLKFAQKAGIYKVYDDKTPNYSGNSTVLMFLANAQLNENSKQTYAKALKEFYKYIESKQVPIGRITVLNFISFLKAKKCSPYTINTYLAAIKQYVEYCVVNRENLELSEDVSQQLRDVVSIKGLKLGGTTKTYSKDSLSKAERDKLLTLVTDPRDKAVIALMAYQGLRTIEVVRLEWKDIKKRENKWFLAVLGKGRNEKEYIPLLDPCKKILGDYRKNTFNINGQMFGFGDTSMVRKITNKWLKLAELKREKVSAHSLRHTVAQLMIDQGVPKSMVQRFLRHKSEATTSIYTAKQEDKDFLHFKFE